MLFRKKYDRGIEIMRRKNEEYLKKQNPSLYEEKGEEPENHKPEPPELEKNDLKAIILSAFLVFGPILLILLVLAAVAWILLH